jgi:hypothetical protein
LKALNLAAVCAAFAITLGATSAAVATEPFYLGTWKFTAGVAAPWADAHRRADTRERSRLLGRALVFKAGAIAGPEPFACKEPHYTLSHFPADMIFQGAFDEMRSKHPSANPNKLAASLGFSAGPIQTLETGCEIDFHFVNPATAEAALNDYVYTLKKQ